MSQPAIPQHPTLHLGAAADRRLAGLGIDPQRLFAALDAGDVAARQPDEFSPVMASGIMRWLETVRMLRRGLVADGWRLNDDRNSPRVIHPEGRVAVVAVSGNPETGMPEGDPRTANPRGAASSRAVLINGQLELGPNWPALLADMAAEKSGRVATWFLLYYRSQGDELRAELSLPVGISDKGIVKAWSERILLPWRSYGATLELPLIAGGDDDDIQFDVAAR